jgi:predicted kinase
MLENADVVPAGRHVFISGPPGAGKSTISRLVAEQFDRSVYIDADIIRESIVSGFEPPSLPVTEDFVRQTELQREIVIAWAERMARAGFVPVVDDAPIPSPEGFSAQYASFWSDPRTVRVMLLPDADEVRRRIAERKGPFDDFLIGVVDRSLSSIARLELDEWHTVNSAGQSPEETADVVLALVR